MLAIASCGGNKAEIPCSKVTGSQPELVAVVGNAQLTLSDGDKSGTMVNLTVKLKSNKPLENLDTAKIDDIQLSSDMLVDIIGKDGSKLCSLSLFGDADKVAIKKMLASGNEAEVTFAKVMVDGDKAKEVLKNAAKFTLTMPEVKYPLCLNLAGTIAGKAVQMTLCIGLDHNVKGAYYYKQSGPKAIMILKGSQDDSGLIEIDEYNPDAIFIGSQQFSPEGTKLVGTYKERDMTYFFGRKYPISLATDKSMARIDLSKVDFNYYNKDYLPLMDEIEGGAFTGISHFNYNRADDYLKAYEALLIDHNTFDKRTDKMIGQELTPYLTPAMRLTGVDYFITDCLSDINVKKLTAAQAQRLKRIKKQYGSQLVNDEY